jgi:hypothetical protein
MDSCGLAWQGSLHNQIMVQLKEGRSIKPVIAWARDELKGFAR